MLRVIDMGRCSGVELTLCADLPALTGADECTAIFGVADDEHLSIGYNVHWDAYFQGDYRNYTLSRFSAKGGMMYYRGVALFRFWAPVQVIQPPALEQLVHRVVMEVTGKYAGDSELSHHDNYVYVDGMKFAGTSDNWINGQSNCILCINKEFVDFAAIKGIFKTKRLHKLTDLSGYAIPETYYLELAERLAEHLGMAAQDSAFTGRERQLIDGLRVVHSSDEWLWKAQREDLECVPPDGLGFAID